MQGFKVLHWHLIGPLRSYFCSHLRLDNRLIVQLSIITICEPAKSIMNFSIPWSLLFPSHFLYILYSVESKVNRKTRIRPLKILLFLRFELEPLHIFKFAAFTWSKYFVATELMTWDYDLTLVSLIVSCLFAIAKVDRWNLWSFVLTWCNFYVHFTFQSLHPLPVLILLASR